MDDSEPLLSVERDASAAEIWRCDFAAPHGWAGAVEFGLSTHTTVTGAWYRFLITETHAPPRRRATIFVADDQLRFPPPGSLEVRGSGIWSELAVQESGEHLPVDLEAFGVDVGTERDLSALIYGDRVAVGCELSFETVVGAVGSTADVTAGLPCRVTGDLLIGQDVVELNAFGWRSRSRTPDASVVRGWGGDLVAPHFSADDCSAHSAADPSADSADVRGDRFMLGAEVGTAATAGASSVEFTECFRDGSSWRAWVWR